MKLRLPHRLHAALVAALASVSFTTLCSGALTAAFFLGSQAFAEEADDNPGATIDIGDTNLDAQAAIDEEEGKGEDKEPGSAPINQAGFNGIRGSSDDFDRQSTAATEASIDTENVGTADQANYGSTSADLPSNDLGFTANSYASGSSNGSVVDSPVTSFTPATAVPAVLQVQYVESTAPTTSSGTATTGAATGGYSATPVSGATGGGSGYNLSSPAMPRAAVVTVPATTDATDPAAEAAMTDSGSADSTPADDLGSTTTSLSVGGASLVRALYSSPAPAMLSAADQQAQAEQYKGMEFSGYIYNIDTSASGTFHNRDFTNYYSPDGGTTWLNSTVFNGDDSNKIYYNGTQQKTTTGGVNFWRFAFGDGNGKYSTLRLTDATANVYLETQFSPFYLGGLIAEAGDYTYAVGRQPSNKDCALTLRAEEGQKANMSIASNVHLSARNGFTVASSGTWDVASGKTLAVGRYDSGSNVDSVQNNNSITFNDGLHVDMTGGGTVDLTHTNALTVGQGTTISVGADTTLLFASATTLAGTINNEGTVTFRGAVGGLAHTISNEGTITFNGTVTLGSLSLFESEGSYVDYRGATGAQDGFAGDMTYTIIKGNGQYDNLQTVSYNSTNYTLDAGKISVTGSTDFSTYHLNTNGADLDLAQAMATASNQLTTVEAKGTNQTITVGSDQNLANLNLLAGASVTTAGTGTLTLGALSNGGTLNIGSKVTMGTVAFTSSDAPAIHVTEGGVYTILSNSTVDGKSIGSGTGTSEMSNDAFTKLFKGRVVDVQDGGRLVLQGNVISCDTSVSGTPTQTSGVAAMEITGNLQINTWGNGCTWALGSHSLEVGGNFWLTNKQYLTLNGGTLGVDGQLLLGHSGNTGSYPASVTATGNSSITLGGIGLYGPGNAFSLTGGNLTFTAASAATNVLTNEGSNAHNNNTITLAGTTLHAGENGWTLAPVDGATVSVSGTTTVDVASSKQISLTANSINGKFVFAEGSTGTLLLNSANGVLTESLALNGATVGFAGTWDLSALDDGSTPPEYIDGENEGNGFIKLRPSVTLASGGTITDGSADATFKIHGATGTLDVAAGTVSTSGEPDYSTFHVMTLSENVSQGRLNSHDPVYSLADSTRLVVDADLTGAKLTRESGSTGNATLEIQSGKTYTSDGNVKQVTITGAGTYALKSGTYAMVDSLAQGENGWTGTVVITNAGNKATINEESLVNGTYSTLQMEGFNGWFGNNHWYGERNQNIKLVDYVNASGSTVSAWKNGAASSQGTYTETFSGTWSGEGTFERIGSNRMDYAYTGNIAAWNGKFLMSGNGITYLKFSGNANIVNAAIERANGTLNVVVDTNATFNNAVSATDLTVKDNATAIFGQNATLTVDNLTVNAGGTLDVFTDGLTATTVSVNGGTITNSGQGTRTLDITTLNVGGNGAIVSGNVSLGTSTDLMATLHLENTLISKGNNAVYANAVTFVGDLGESVGAGSTFKDTVSGDTANGYVVTAKVVIVENAAGTTLTTNLGDGKHTITHDGWTYTLQQDNVSGSIYISLTASTERAMQGDYYVNSGTLTYGDSGNASGQERTNTLFVNGGNLVFTDTDLKTGVNLHVHKNGEVSLGKGRTLNEGLVHVKAGATMTLDGSGTYVLSPATLGAHASMPAGTVLAKGENGFTGTVMVSKDSVLNGTDLSGLVNDTYSRVGFNGATGSLKIGEIAQNIYLQDYGSQAALSLNTGTSGETHTFTGAITGTGTLARSYVDGSGNIGGVQNYEFSGNLSGWTGVFDNQVEGAANTTNLTFSGQATEINAEIKNGVAGSTGPLNVITTGDADKQFNKGVTATSFSANGGTVTFNGSLRLTGNASATDGAKLVINNSATVGGSLSGDVEVTKTGNLTVGGTADLSGLTVDGMASFNGTISTSGAVTVNEGASLYLNGGGFSLGNGAAITIKDGAKVGLTGWQAKDDTRTVDSQSGVYTSGFTNGQLFKLPAVGTRYDFEVESGAVFMKDGAEFLYDSAQEKSRVIVDTEGTVEIITAVYYYVAGSDTRSMDDVKAAAGEKPLDYILIQDKGTLSGVTDENKGSFGISSVQGSGTISVGTGTLTDSAAFVNFTGTIRVDAGGTFETDGTITRAITMNGGTLHATDNIDLSRNVTYAAGSTSTLDISDGKSVTMTQAVTANLDKRGEGTLHITDTTSGGTRSPMLTGNLHVYEGTTVISSKRHGNDNCGVVNGSITVEQGADLIMEGFDALGHSNNSTNYTKKITLNAGTAENLTTLAFTRNGSDPTTLQHTTLSTDIEMNGNTEMSGLRLNAFGKHNENNLGDGAYIHVSGMNNTITNTFAMRYNAYFQVDANSELTMLGNMELFDSGAESKKVIKTGTGVLDFAGDNSTLHAIDIQAGTVEVTGNLTFTGPNANQFLMAEGAEFAVQNGATFNYKGWLFENKDGTHAAGTVTAAASSTTNILEDSKLVVSGMKLTNNNTGNQAISARLDGVQLMHTGGNVTINNAPVGTTQHIASLTVKTGETTLHSAKLDAASVNPGATLSFSDDGKVELGSTILNGGTVNLAGTINVSDLSSFTPQKGAGFLDTKIHTDTPSDTYNGFYQGSTYYLIQEEAGGSTVSVAENLALTYKGNSVTDFAKETGTHSYWFRVAEPSTLYYLNGEVGANTIYRENSTENLMCAGPGEGMHTTGIVMNAAGARLTLASDLLENVRTITEGSSGIEAKQNGTIDIQSGVTLHQSDLSGDSGVLVSLVGEGTFDLVGTELKSVSSGLTDGSAWQGTVRASGAADNMNATMMGNVNSTLLLDGVKGTLTNDDTQYVMKVVLQNGNGALTGKALDNTFSTGAHRTFTNTVSGSGDILMTGEASGFTQRIAFTGDVKGWTGDFTTASRGTTNLAFNNKATEINADVIQGAGSTINLSVGPTVDAEGDPAEQVFNGNVTASSLTVEAGANTTLNNTTTISGVIDVTADDAVLNVQGTTTANEVKLGGGQVGINNAKGDSMVAIVSSSDNGDGDITGGVTMQSAEGTAILAGTAGPEPVSRVDGANMFLLDEAASLQIENLVLAADTKVSGAYVQQGNLVISQKVVQEMSETNTEDGKSGTLSAKTLTLTGTTGTEAQAKGDKLFSLDFTGMSTMASLSGNSATLLQTKAASSGNSATLLMDFTGMYTAEEWADMIRDIDYLGVNFDSSIANVDFASLTVQAAGYDANGNEATYTGYYAVNNDAKSGANVGMVVYFEVPEPATSTLSLLALAALAARRRRK